MISKLQLWICALLFFGGSYRTAEAQPYSAERQQQKIEFTVKQQKFSKIRAVVDQQLTAWNNGDMKGYMEGYWKSDSLQFITSKGITYGYQQVLENYERSYPTKEKMGDLSFEITGMRFLDVLDQVAQITGNWTVTHGENTSGGNFSLIIKFFGTEPKIIIDHTF